MEATDLRIGNYLIDRQNRLCKVEAIKPDDYEEYEYGFEAPAISGPITGLPHKPIPLTEEWLKERFHESSFVSNLYEVGTLSIYFQDKIAWIDINGNCIELKYVHQLQNLYFALTGKELEIK